MVGNWRTRRTHHTDQELCGGNATHVTDIHYMVKNKCTPDLSHLHSLNSLYIYKNIIYIWPGDSTKKVFPGVILRKGMKIPFAQDMSIKYYKSFIVVKRLRL